MRPSIGPSSADAIDRQIRAFDPVPGATTHFGVLGSRSGAPSPVAREIDAAAGTVFAPDRDGIDVACGHGALRLREVQPASGKRMSASAFAAGHGVLAGTRFGASAAS